MATSSVDTTCAVSNEVGHRLLLRPRAIRAVNAQEEDMRGRVGNRPVATAPRPWRRRLCMATTPREDTANPRENPGIAPRLDPC